MRSLWKNVKYSDVVSKIDTIPLYATETRTYDDFISNLTYNLESGFISQTEYEQLLKESTMFAEIID